MESCGLLGHLRRSSSASSQMERPALRPQLLSHSPSRTGQVPQGVGTHSACTAGLCNVASRDNIDFSELKKLDKLKSRTKTKELMLVCAMCACLGI